MQVSEMLSGPSQSFTCLSAFMKLKTGNQNLAAEILSLHRKRIAKVQEDKLHVFSLSIFLLSAYNWSVKHSFRTLAVSVWEI